MDRVGLGAVVSELLGVQLEKAHSAVDWSTRPLPEPWLEYAALDVELLVDLRDVMTVMLDEAGKADYARQEFRATLDKPEKELAIEPWRRLSGLHTLRSTRLVAIARELWLARDRIAAQRDVAPGRLVPDASLVAAVAANPESKVALSKVKAFNGRASRSLIDEWWAAIERGRRSEDLPALRVKTAELPPARAWAERNPEAHERLLRMRPRMQAVSENLQIPIENLLTPALLRSVAWEPPPVVDEHHVATALLSGGARPWQVEICGPLIVDALLDESPLPVVDPPLEDHVSTE
jgi:ribonuclease D